jgi:fructokinase
VKAGFLGGISRDHFGALLAGILVHEGIDDRFLVRTPKAVTGNVKLKRPQDWRLRARICIQA